MCADFCQRPSKIFVDLAALENNFLEIKKKCAGSKILSVVKANAYGHGLIECSKRLESIGSDYLGVALVEEGEALRKSGIKIPIHVFGGILDSQIERYLKSDLEITASSISKVEAISKVAESLGIQAKIHLKIDTGMGRIGVRPESAEALIRLCKEKANNLSIKGVFSHFACSEDLDLEFTEFQLKKFLEVLKLAKFELGPQVLGHISNSGSICQLPKANLDMVRPGICLYGVFPARHLSTALNLKPVMRVESQVVYFKLVSSGTSVSYGRTWFAKKDTRVVTVPIGYGDGYIRALSNKASVLIRGKRFPIIGRICMDQVMVSLDNSEAYNGDKVTLIGKDGEEEIKVEELAELAGTVPHEILSLLNLRMQRTFLN